MASIILPYKNLGETLAVNLDLSKIPHTVIGERSALVDVSKAGPSISVPIEAQIPNGISDVFPAAERKKPPLQVVATTLSIDAGFRQHVTMKQQKANLYTGAVVLDLNQIAEAAELSVYVVRSSNGSSKGGFAKHRGSRLAWSPTYEIRFAERPKKGNFLTIEWEDFGNSTIVPANFERSLYYVDTEAEPPILYLNKLAKPPLIKMIETQGFGHDKALPRDVLYRSLSTNVWFVLAQAALEALHNEALQTGVPVDLGEAFGGSWKQEVIELLAPRALPSMMPEDAVGEFCSKMNESSYFASALLRAQLAVQADQELLEHFERMAEREFSRG
jgi:hypothetical protein